MTTSPRAAVVGVGTTTFGRLPGLSADDLGGWALREAIADAGLTPAASTVSSPAASAATK
ncbi:hypothetical protein [Rhodococcus opacus]|uniref:hypothetical protein n=1 Tax=Rhodococcus opacus TaxID=37919 RepID=UPI0021C67CE4|nr:hypothetical protein [Rhodococcus opacus]